MLDNGCEIFGCDPDAFGGGGDGVEAKAHE
jgi:hypothetical protein